MPIEQLTYAQIAERLGVSTEAARAIVKRHRLPRSRSNDGKTLAAIDLEEIRHKPLPARSPRGDHAVTDVVATLKAKVAELEAELAAEQQRSAGHRADYERERERTDRMVTTQDRMVAELEPPHAFGSGTSVCPGGHPSDMERDDLGPTHPLAAHDRMTRHVMVGFPDPAVRSLPPEKHAAGGHLPPAPRLALDAGDGVGPEMEGFAVRMMLVDWAAKSRPQTYCMYE
jgi:hypothetical protein